MKKEGIEERIDNFRKASKNFNNDERVRNLLIELGKIHDEYASEFKGDFYFHLIEQLESYDSFSIPDAFGFFVIKKSSTLNSKGEEAYPNSFFREENEDSDSFWEHVAERIIDNEDDDDEDFDDDEED